MGQEKVLISTIFSKSVNDYDAKIMVYIQGRRYGGAEGRPPPYDFSSSEKRKKKKGKKEKEEEKGRKGKK